MKAKDVTSVTAVLFKSKTLANGEHPIMLRVIKGRQPSYRSLGVSCHPKYWNFEQQRPKRNHPHREYLEKIIDTAIREYKDKVWELKSEGKNFTSDALINSVYNPGRKTTVIAYWEEYIKRLVDTNKIGNAKAHKAPLYAFKSFLDNKDIAFNQVDYNLLVRFKEWLQKRGLADTSLSVYFRSLRSIYNKAVAEKVAKATDYPFNDFKITQFDTSTRKRAITKAEIKGIEKLKLKQGPYLYQARQYFLFSYYCQGMNFTDIAFLKWENEMNGRLSYIRAKTGKLFNFKLLPPAQEIIEAWRPVNGHKKDNYIFPILDREKHITAVQIDNRIHKVLGNVNKGLKELGTMAGIPIPLTTYVARHTMATTLKKEGKSTALISEIMGHKTEGITQTYLDSFENEVLDSAMEALL